MNNRGLWRCSSLSSYSYPGLSATLHRALHQFSGGHTSLPLVADSLFSTALFGRQNPKKDFLKRTAAVNTAVLLLFLCQMFSIQWRHWLTAALSDLKTKISAELTCTTDFEPGNGLGRNGGERAWTERRGMDQVESETCRNRSRSRIDLMEQV